MSSPAVSPFAVLGIAPTLDPGALKRGYFAALHRHPPHLDPTGFRRIREAYEKLSRSDELTEAYMSSPLDVGPALSELDATIGQDIALAGERSRLREQGAVEKTAALDALSRLGLADALKIFAARPG